MEDGPRTTSVIKSLAVYMRQQYLIWNKDSVADETIFKDIEKLSDYRIKVPEGIQLSRISSDASFQRPGIGQQKSGGKPQQRQKGMRSKKNRK